jgi:type IV pilus assembly protein PilX
MGNKIRYEKGAALIIALLMLLVLTLIGISAIGTTTFETKIAGNERIGTEAFYVSEGGVQVGLNKLPDDTPISRKKVGEDSYYWGGSPKDKENPKPIQFVGNVWMPGFQVPGSEPTPGEFLRYQINATGESFGATKEVEVQVSYGPVSTQ